MKTSFSLFEQGLQARFLFPIYLVALLEACSPDIVGTWKADVPGTLSKVLQVPDELSNDFENVETYKAYLADKLHLLSLEFKSERIRLFLTSKELHKAKRRLEYTDKEFLWDDPENGSYQLYSWVSGPAAEYYGKFKIEKDRGVWRAEHAHVKRWWLGLDEILFNRSDRN